MEVRANYLAVGIFAIATITIVGFIVSWLVNVGDQRNFINIDVVFTDSVTGLNIGNSVQFNGITVGTVQSIRFDAKNPRRVIANIKVDGNAPIKADTKARLGLSGLTGIAFVDLSGGSDDAPLVANLLARNQKVLLIAEASPIQSFIDNSQDILISLLQAIDKVNDVLDENHKPVSRIIDSLDKITLAIGSNSADLSEFMTSLSKAIENLQGFSKVVEPLTQQMTRIAKAINDKDVGHVVDNIKTSSDNLVAMTDNGRMLVDELTKASANIDKIVNSVDADEIRTIVTSTKEAVGNINVLASQYQGSGDKLSGLIDNLNETSGQVRESFAKIDPAIDNINKVTSSLDDQLITSIVRNADAVTRQLAGKGDELSNLIVQTRQVFDNISDFTSSLNAEQSKNIGQIITDVSESAKKIKATVDDFSKIVATLTKDIDDGHGHSLAKEVGITLRSIRNAANSLQKQLGTNSGRGLGELDAVMKDARRALQKIERAASEIENNPQRFIFGGESKPVYNPR